MQKKQYICSRIYISVLWPYDNSNFWKCNEDEHLE